MGDNSSALGGVLIGIGCSVFVVFCVIIMCASYCRREEYEYEIDMIDGRDLLLRENLADTVMDDGKSEWQCIVCLHMNHPNHEACTLCGAHVEASLLTGTALAATHLLTNNSTMLSATMMNNTSFLLTSSEMPLLRASSSASDHNTLSHSKSRAAVSTTQPDAAQSEAARRQPTTSVAARAASERCVRLGAHDDTRTGASQV
jgi:hypothetical protein